MENLARKLQQERQKQVVKQPAAKPKKKPSYRITLGEKIIVAAFCAALCFGGFHIISNQVSIYQMNKNIQETKVALSEQQKINEDLKVHVDELSTYERIWAKAKELDLKFRDNNVKVVQKHD